QELGTLGFECSPQEVDPEDITENRTNTVRACTAPSAAVRDADTRDAHGFPHSLTKFLLLFPPFPQGKCLQGISEDLRAFRAELRKLQEPGLLQALDELLEVSIP
ncbi:IL12A protein, partial [Panurus biarmicus]|nr:IL12A protein [Panurus biarmicus]